MIMRAMIQLLGGPKTRVRAKNVESLQQVVVGFEIKTLNFFWSSLTTKPFYLCL